MLLQAWLSLCESDNEEADNSDRPDLIRLPLLASATVDRMDAFSLIHALSASPSRLLSLSLSLPLSSLSPSLSSLSPLSLPLSL